MLAASPDPARLLRRIGINFDTCHFALQYEDVRVSLGALVSAGLRISKIHLSSALALDPRDPAAIECLRGFDEPVYSHQVVARGEDGTLRRHLDLPDALALLRDRNFLVFFVASILICIPLAFYYQHANQFLTEIQVANATGIQTLGQMSEVGFMLLVPFFLKRFGMKMTLLLGMLAWAARYVLFAYGNAGELVFMLILGIALHGVCYDFFFVSGQVFTDSKAGPRYKSAAQGLITLATYGVGMLIGFWIAGQLTDAFASGAGVHDWRSIWIYPAAFAAVVAVLFALLFRNEVVSYKPAPTGTPARNHG